MCVQCGDVKRGYCEEKRKTIFEIGRYLCFVWTTRQIVNENGNIDDLCKLFSFSSSSSSSLSLCVDDFGLVKSAWFIGHSLIQTLRERKKNEKKKWNDRLLLDCIYLSACRVNNEKNDEKINIFSWDISFEHYFFSIWNREQRQTLAHILTRRQARAKTHARIISCMHHRRTTISLFFHLHMLGQHQHDSVAYTHKTSVGT